ncbi:lasso peptide biosynthesis B2 protein [Streptomyces sp. NPDC094034]|uniref:lasso peptide biosynthesis B2 protein n=1 Tax=Streptomyces sp. NPDC094034 TaxID=3155309 RepID=UPI003322E6E1
MSIPVLPADAVTVSLGQRLVTRAVVGAARVLARRQPRHIRAVLIRVRRGARPATVAEAGLARDTVLTVSPRCCGARACLVRSIATALLCRTRSVWPTWCVGVLKAPPFAAHAWVEAEGRMVDEATEAGYYTRLITIEASGELPSPGTEHGNRGGGDNHGDGEGELRGSGRDGARFVR